MHCNEVSPLLSESCLVYKSQNAIIKSAREQGTKPTSISVRCSSQLVKKQNPTTT